MYVWKIKYVWKESREIFFFFFFFFFIFFFNNDTNNNHNDNNNNSIMMIITIITSLQSLGNAIQWLLLFAAKFEKEQLRVQEELDRVVGRDRLPTLSDRKNLPYTEAFMVESMRCAVGGPFGEYCERILETSE